MSKSPSRMYETSLDDIANGAPLKRNIESFANTRKSRSRSPAGRPAVATGEAGREIRSLKREIDALELENQKLTKQGTSRNKQVDALDDLLQRERSALQEVLKAARKRVKDVEAERDDYSMQLVEESRKVLSFEMRIATMKEEHTAKVHGLAQQNSQLKEELRAAREKLKAIAAKASADLAAEREDHQRVVVSMKREFATAETRWTNLQLAMQTDIDRQFSLLRIWREIIADLRLRLKFLQMWTFGFRRWHFNMLILQHEAHAEHEEAMRLLEEASPKLDDFHIESWDIHAIAASEFGMKDADGDGIMDSQEDEFDARKLLGL